MLILLLFPVVAFGQIGGRDIYDFLRLTPQARLAGLGGVNITTVDHDQNFAFNNPAVLNDSMHNRFSLSYVKHLAGINYGYASYARSFDGIADFHAGIQYVNYGQMTEADEFGNITGNFSANDVALVVGASRQFYRFRIGANVKFINSNNAGYNSFTGLGLDIGGLYLSEDGLLHVAILFQNIGVQWQKYTGSSQREALPFEVQAGVSYKLKHMPLRFSATATNLEHPRLIYQDPDPEPVFDLSGEEIKPKSRVGDNIFGHFVFGAEFLISKHFQVRFGYNHLRRTELRAQNKAGLAGFSGGLGIMISQVSLDYSYVHFHAIGGTHSFTLSTSIDRFKKGAGKKLKVKKVKTPITPAATPAVDK